MPQRGRSRNRETKTPTTRRAEHRKINALIQDVMSDLRKFQKTHFGGKTVDYHAGSECLDKLLEEWQMDKDSISTWKEFEELSKSKPVDKKIKSSDEFKILLNLCRRAKDFEVMIPDVRTKIVSCVNNHVYKYCHSFEKDAQPFEITPVQDYESLITSSKAEINEKLDAANHSILRYGELKSPFYKFAFDGQEHGTLMEDITANFSEICKLLRNWVKEDSSYPEKLNQEIQFNASYKEKMQDEINTLEKKKMTNTQQIEKMQRSRTKLEADYDTHKREKMKTKRRLETVECKIEKMEEDKQKLSEKIEEDKEKRSQKTPRSPREKSDLDRQIDKGERDLDLMGEREGPMRRQRSRMRRDLKQVSDRTYELKVEVVTLRHKQFELRQEIGGIELEITSIQERIKSIDEKISTIRRIRDKKLSPASLRKRHLEKRNDPEPEDKLHDACQDVAESIGDDWKGLYDRLPFIPSRDKSRRQRDVEILDMIAAKRDRTAQEQAQQSLDKWRWFNRQGDVTQLIKTLRKMHKVDIARKLESKYMVEGIYG